MWSNISLAKDRWAVYRVGFTDSKKLFFFKFEFLYSPPVLVITLINPVRKLGSERSNNLLKVIVSN